MGGPNLRVQPSTLTTGGLRFSTVTTAISYLIDVQGNFCQFHDVAFFNNGAATTNLGDIGIVGKNNFFSGVDARGGNNTTQNQATTPFAGVPVVFKAGVGYGNATTFLNCQLGSAGNTVRTAGPGCMLFLGGVGTQAFDTRLINCTLEMQSETSGSSGVGAIMENSSVYAIDRYLLLDGCFVYNFWTSHGGKVDYAIVVASGSPTTHDIIIKRTTFVGFDFIANDATFVRADMPDVADGGGVVEGVKVS